MYASPPIVDWKALFECPLCLQTLSSPISTACGHTFCSTCLSRALASSPQCPLCRAPCYLQPSYSLGRKPVVLLEKCIEYTIGKPKDENINENGEFRLGLFFLQESSFSTVPNRLFKIRAFEPYVLLLIRRCVEQGVRFGLQASSGDRRGFIVRVDKISPYPDRIHTHHLLVECFTEGLYELTTDPVEEQSTGGLHYAMARQINSFIGMEDTEDVLQLATQAKRLFDASIRSLQPSEAAIIFEDIYTGAMRAVPSDPVEFSFFLIDALQLHNEGKVIFEPDVKKRLQACIDALNESPVKYKRLVSREVFSRSRENLDFSRNILFASGLVIFFGVVLGGFDSLFKRS